MSNQFKICPVCSEKNNPNFSNCWKCNALLTESFSEQGEKTSVPVAETGNKRPSNLLLVFEILEAFSQSIYENYCKIKGKNEYIKEMSATVYLEVFFFVLWEMDVCLFSCKQNQEIRQKSFMSYLKAATKITGNEDRFKEIADVAFKRLDEYGAAERQGDGKIGALEDLVTGYFIYNLDYAIENEEFYICKNKARPIGLGIMTKFQFGLLMMQMHMRIRGYLQYLFQGTVDFSKVDQGVFQSQVSEAKEKDILFQKKLSEKTK